MSKTPHEEHGSAGKPREEQALEQAEVPELLTLVRAYGRPAALVLLLALAVAGGSAMVRQRRHAAAVDAALRFGQAETIEELQAVAEEFPETPSGPLALLAHAARLLEEDRPEEAADRVDLFLRRYPDHAMRPGARMLRAACDEAKEAWDRARAAYEDVLDDASAAYLHAEARLGLGRALEGAGRLREARDLYEDFLAAEPGSAWAPDFETALRSVERRLRGEAG